MRSLRRASLTLLHSAEIIGAISLVTYIGFRLLAVNATTAGFVYLLVVLLAAAFLGLFESVLASVLASLCFNFFFLPPILHWTIADPQNWVAYLTFLVTALLTSKLAEDARRQTRAVNERRLEMEGLYTLSRAVLLIESTEEMATRAVRHIAQIFGIPAVSLFDRGTGAIHRAGDLEMPEWDERLREIALQGSQFVDPATRTLLTAVRLGAEPIGSLAMQRVHLSDSALQSLVNLVAIVLERARTLDRANRADVARQSQELKSTLLDAIAHEFKTPLTSIKAAASAILSDRALGPELEREMASIVVEESDRLGRLVTEAIQMARIEAGRVQLRKRSHLLREVVQRILSAMGDALQSRQVDVEIPANLAPVEVDIELIELALRQILDNAVKYSTPGTPLTVRGSENEGRLLLGIRNEGPDIPEAEQSQIFEKFYRVPDANRGVSGTGMGLAIARDIVQAHRGQIWVESSPGRGVEVCLSLPSAVKEVAA